MMINVQFMDDSEEAIIGYYGSPQTNLIFTHMGKVDTSDPKWKVYFDSQSPMVQPWLPAPTDD